MKKIMNSPNAFCNETVEGILLAHSDKLKALNNDLRIIVRNDKVKEGKVGIVTAGGSGHLPVFLGYVGQGMLDGCAVGNVFASPSAKKMYNMIADCDKGNGVLCLYGNYGGDNMNFDMACDMADMEDINTKSIRVCDDVASAPKDKKEKRRGVAGMVFAWKIAGAAADKMMSLDEVTKVTNHALENIRSMGVALSPCIVPQVGKPTFSINDDEIEIGMGIHGEVGIEVRKMLTADEIVKVLLDRICEDMEIKKDDEIAVMINGLGATPMEELYICYRAAHKYFESMEVNILTPYIGEFATSMEMAGMSVSVMKLDSVLKELLEYPASTPFFTNGNR
ncbi:dihydroxyacetone kinase subunit DhaK [Clostridium sediminicola]|uniref:dihydroxyacetone kinase subunit DhaK n=1 Tax=Clostridium sediminicola TaxID=3114879 RepID=UPI0031F251A6